jgi:hypothetical protein
MNLLPSELDRSGACKVSFASIRESYRGRIASMQGLYHFLVQSFFLRGGQPPAGAGRPPNVRLPIQKPFAETWYYTILRPRLS